MSACFSTGYKLVLSFMFLRVPLGPSAPTPCVCTICLLKLHEAIFTGARFVAVLTPSAPRYIDPFGTIISELCIDPYTSSLLHALQSLSVNTNQTNSYK